MIYLVGSLRNPRVPEVARALRQAGHDVYDDWYASGPEADDHWMAYERARGRTYQEALAGWAATHTFQNDRQHLDEADAGVLVAPAGRSGHLEVGYLVGQGKPAFMLIEDEPERWDFMVKFATVCRSMDELLRRLP